MAKTKKVPEVFYQKDGVTLGVAPSFLYERLVFKRSDKRYFLDDSVFVLEKELLKKLTVYSPDKTESHFNTLVGAPSKWLIENGYQLCKQ